MNASRLYMLYSEFFSDDSNFWWQLSLEEKYHASLIKSSEAYLDLGILPDEILYDDLSVIIKLNAGIRSFIESAHNSPPPKEVAYRFALDMEESAVELHYQNIMEQESGPRVVQIFQRLGRDDMDHARRIRELMGEGSGLIP